MTLFPTVNTCHTSGQPLGLESGALPDSAFSESSCYSASYCSIFGRLNSETTWAAYSSDQYQWMQIQFESSYVVTAITTQGRNNADQWVTSYTFSSSFDNMAWTDYLNVYSGSVEVNAKQYCSGYWNVDLPWEERKSRKKKTYFHDDHNWLFITTMCVVSFLLIHSPYRVMK